MEFRWKTLLLLSVLLPAIVQCEDAANAILAADLQEAVEAQQAGEEVTEPVEAKIIKEAPIGVLPSGTGDVATTGTGKKILVVMRFLPFLGFGAKNFVQC